MAALAVGIELGIQPILFHDDRREAAVSPYDLQPAIPAMVAAHAFGASIVEALITFLGVAYLQKRHPAYLTSLRSVYAPDGVTGTARPRRDRSGRSCSESARWRSSCSAPSGSSSAVGTPAGFFGADWSVVSWADVATMLLITAVIAIVPVPLAYLVLPRRLKRIGSSFTLIAVIAPLGLIAPGFAYGEGSTEDVQAAFGYIPKGLQDLSGIFSAPLSGYNMPLPFFSGANAPLWHAAIGYEIAGIVGILLVGGVVVLAASRGCSAPAAEPWPRRSARPDRRGLRRDAGAGGPGSRPPSRASAKGRIGWLEQTLGGITESIEHAVFTEQHARWTACCSARDPRAKLGMFLALVLAASLTGSLGVLAAIYAVDPARRPGQPRAVRVLRQARLAGHPVLRRASWSSPPSSWCPGPRLFELPLGPVQVAPSVTGIIGAVDVRGARRGSACRWPCSW